MVSKRPFFCAPAEKTEIRNLFKVISAGGNPFEHPELQNVYPRYKTVFDIFDVCIDVRYGNFIHLPFAGAVMDQPSKTMDCLKLAQHLYRQKIAEDEKKKNTVTRRR